MVGNCAGGWPLHGQYGHYGHGQCCRHCIMTYYPGEAPHTSPDRHLTVGANSHVSVWWLSRTMRQSAVSLSDSRQRAVAAVAAGAPYVGAVLEPAVGGAMVTRLHSNTRMTKFDGYLLK